MDPEPALLKPWSRQVYRSWSALAGYFDGDGTVEFSIHTFTLRIRLAFDENWKPHLDGLRSFLKARGIKCGSVRRKDGYNTWHVVISNKRGVVEMAKRMLDHTVKKKSDLQAVLSYYGDRITGDEFLQTMNGLVLAGERTGKNRGRGPDFTYSRAVLESRRAGEKKRVAKRTLVLPETLAKSIKPDREEKSLSLLELSKRYRHSIPVIKRALVSR